MCLFVMHVAYARFSGFVYFLVWRSHLLDSNMCLVKSCVMIKEFYYNLSVFPPWPRCARNNDMSNNIAVLSQTSGTQAKGVLWDGSVPSAQYYQVPGRN